MCTYQKVCLVGIDRVVGSFALGLKRIGFAGPIVVVADAATIDQSLREMLISEGSQNLSEAVAGADLIIMAPRNPCRITLAEVLDAADAGATVCETSRVKENVNAVFERRGRRDVRYLGFRLMGEPADEQNASESGRYFFDGKCVVLTPRGHDDLEAYARLQETLQQMGARVVGMSRQSYNQSLADLSQVPRAAIVAVLQQVMDAGAETKIAPEMLGGWLREGIREVSALRAQGWAEDVAANRERVLSGIDGILERLQRLKSDLAENRFAAQLDALVQRAETVVPREPVSAAAELVLVAGDDLRVIEKASELLANGRISIEALDRMQNAASGAYRIRLKSADERDRALRLLRHAGVDVENLS